MIGVRSVGKLPQRGVVDRGECRKSVVETSEKRESGRRWKERHDQVC